jgi:hypothetical protein
MLNSGSTHGLTVQQSYLTFTYGLLQNANVGAITTTCEITSTVTGDFTVFESYLQNEVCNGPDNCILRGKLVHAGSIGFASGALLNCPDGCDGYFRVAQIGLCAVGEGTAILHWQFSPPDPITRDTEIMNIAGDLVHDPALFTDYIINITAPTPSPTTTATPTPCGVSFADVQPTDYFYTAVLALACRHVISGYLDGTFRPYNYTSRGQFCKIITLAEGWQIECPRVHHFADVFEVSPFYCYIETAYSHGIISGYDDGTFRLYNNVTRAQTCKIVTLAEGWTQVCPEQPSFPDVPPSNPFFCFVETAYEHLVISGYADGSFRPYNDVVRGQLCKMVFISVNSP